jgi:hypothetical protein
MVKTMLLPKKGKYPNLERAGFLLPINVSMNEDGKMQAHGTKAFAVVGTKISDVNASKRESLRAIANQSPFFIKKCSARQGQIVKKLSDAGIETEPVVLAMNDGWAVFEKSGYALSSDAGMDMFCRNFWANTFALEGMVTKMHSLGITHNHLHRGNITIDEKRKIRLIDMGKATVIDINGLKNPAKGWAFKKFFPDLIHVSDVLYAIGMLGGNGILPEFKNAVSGSIVYQYSTELMEKMGSEIFDLAKLVKC